MRTILRLLMVDDNPADVGLAREALAHGPKLSQMSDVGDGDEAMRYLQREGPYAERETPDLVVLDLSLPGKNGMDVLAEVKANPLLKFVPVVIFSTSQLARDVERSYALGANCYISKPGNLNDYRSAVKGIEEYWFSLARLSTNGE